MTADWTTCRVVRDGRGRLRTGDGPIRAVSVGEGLGEEAAAAFAHALGPLTPVLDADGQPAVRTVDDLTARHIGRRVRVEGCEYTLDHIGPSKCLFILDPGGYFPGQQFPLDTPCEVLP